MKSLDDALSQLLGHAVMLEGIEQVPTFDADGRVLAQDLISHLQVPPHDNSSMDGYALRCADLTDQDQALPVSQRIPAGS
ncbi:MAG: putative molybdopterin biosynthesis protein moeA, partial [Pseudomonadota bacterium]